MTHTPGPRHTSNITEIGGGAALTPCTGLAAGEIADAARLIAAAPALLEALEALMLNFEYSERNDWEQLNHYTEFRSELDEARAAIALAKGESK